ncbi:TPA: hypothetical protein HA371_06070 [Candidatus Woesearchaeota archaeon]|nr:hypothetical protein [Candidatus Woesearchaeota archaeon]
MNEGTRIILKASGLSASVLAIFMGAGIGVGIYQDFYNKPIPKPHERGLIWFDANKREYAGIPRDFREGSEQRIYVDRRPFGSLDGVRLEQWVNGQRNVLKERKPEMNEEDTFFLLENIAKKEHSGLY